MVTQPVKGTLTSSDTRQDKFLEALWGYGGPNCDAHITALRTSASDLTPTFATTSTGTAIAPNVVNSTSRPTGCEYYNPLSNGIKQGMQANQATGERVAANPDYEANLANSVALQRYIIDRRKTVSTSELLTLDFVVQGTMGSLAGGDAAWAFGYERRDYNLETTTPAEAGQVQIMLRLISITVLNILVLLWQEMLLQQVELPVLLTL